MAQKRKTGQSKLDAAAALLKSLEEKTAHNVKGRSSDNWRDNLFEIMMTRLELAARHKKAYAAIPGALAEDPLQAPEFAGRFLKTMHHMLKLAKAPATPVHIAVFSALYAATIKTFLDDTSKDLAKTMAALDKNLGMFEQFCGFLKCKS